MLFRVQLTAIMTVAIGFVLILGSALYWGANQAAVNFQHYRSAYEAFELYERLSQEAYRYFKQRMDRLTSGGIAADFGTVSSRQRLDAAMDALRRSVVKAPRETASRQEELERVARFTAFLEASDYRFDEVESLYHQGNRDQAVQVLTLFLEEAIDRQFQPLIDAAIASEHERARAIQANLEALIQRSGWLALVVASTAAISSLAGGYLLLERLNRSIQALIQGADAIATGHLAYRIELSARDEFGHLARQFNEMADNLETQHIRLREHRDALEERVAERTAELQQLNVDLQRMDAERVAFLTDISHELRTPITVIRGEAEVALRSSTGHPSVYREALERVNELSIQLGVYVNDLLQRARAEQRPVLMSMSKLNLTELIAKSFEDLQVLALEGGLVVTLEAPTSPILVVGDESRLRQALFILSDNACRYSRGGGTVKVSLRVAGPSALMSISDKGIGIPSLDLAHIFGRDYRAQNARVYCPDGQGLGLSMAQTIAELHGGRIDVNSAQDEGSTFTITLPLADPHDQADEHERLPG